MSVAKVYQSGRYVIALLEFSSDAVPEKVLAGQFFERIERIRAAFSDLSVGLSFSAHPAWREGLHRRRPTLAFMLPEESTGLASSLTDLVVVEMGRAQSEAEILDFEIVYRDPADLHEARGGKDGATILERLEDACTQVCLDGVRCFGALDQWPSRVIRIMQINALPLQTFGLRGEAASELIRKWAYINARNFESDSGSRLPLESFSRQAEEHSQTLSSNPFDWDDSDREEMWSESLRHFGARLSKLEPMIRKFLAANCLGETPLEEYVGRFVLHRNCLRFGMSPNQETLCLLLFSASMHRQLA